MLAPPGCFLCVKNANKNRRLDKLSQSFYILYKYLPDMNKYLKNVFTIQTIQDIAKFQ